jgi:hypothetical protein
MSAACVLVPTPQLASPEALRVGGEERRDYAAAVTQAREANRADTGSMASTQPAE